jgi:hypothetical protein
VAVISEAWHEAQARMTDRAAEKAAGLSAAPGPAEAGGARRKE